MEPLADAARSRSEADWLVGMNATRAATVKGRSLGGVVSLGRVQTPTLALIVRRDVEIDAFEPETYFQVDARFGLEGPREYIGRWFEGKEDRTAEREVAEAVAAAAGGAPALVTTVKRTERKTRPPLLYDLTSLQRDANSRYGLSAQRTLAAAQRLYEGSTAGAVLTYPRTRSQFLPADQIPTLKGTARSLTGIPAVREAAAYVAGLDVLPLARVVNDAKVDDHHAIVPTGELPRKELTGDDARVFDLVVRRFLAVFHPEAKFEDTEIITEAGGHRFRTRGRRLVEAGWRAAAFGEEAAAEEPAAGDDDELRQSLPQGRGGRAAARARRRRCSRSRPSRRRATPRRRSSRTWRPPGKQIEDEELPRGDEGGGPRDARDPRRDDREADPGRLHRAAREAAAGDVEGPAGDRAAGRPRAHVGSAHRFVGEAPLRHRARRRRARRLHARHPRLHLTDRRVLPRALVRRRARASRRDRAVPQLRRHRSARTGWPTAARPGRAARSPAAASSSGSSRRAAPSRPPRPRELLEKGQTELLDGFKTRPSRARLVLAEGNQVQLIADDGTRLDAPAGPREKIADCPKCDGEIRENSRAYGCSSWKSKKEPGCGFVIWKSTKGRQISIDEARQVIENGASDWMDFKDRKGPFRGRLVLTPDQTVEVQREDEGTEAATQAA